MNAETADLTPEQARDLLAALIHWQIAAVMGDNESDEAPSMITVIRRTDVADTPEPGGMLCDCAVLLRHPEYLDDEMHGVLVYVRQIKPGATEGDEA